MSYLDRLNQVKSALDNDTTRVTGQNDSEYATWDAMITMVLELWDVDPTMIAAMAGMDPAEKWQFAQEGDWDNCWEIAKSLDSRQ